MRSLASALTAGLLFLTISTMSEAAPGDAIYAKPGLIVTVAGGARLNLYCMGSGSPAVVFDSGWEDWSPDWAIVQPRVAKWTRACSYDRAGLGFSGSGPMPRTSVRMADELHDALRRAGIKGPYILVGNAFGGDPARTFAMRYTAETAGLVLAEADASDLEPKALQNDDHSGNAAYLPRVRQCRDAVASGTALPPLSKSHPERTCDRQFFRGLPESEWSREVHASLMRLARTKPAMYAAAISEMEQMPWDETWLRQHSHSLGSRPVRVLTTGHHAVSRLPDPDAHDPKHMEYEHQIALVQARWLSLSSNAKQVFPSDSSEYIAFDAPDAVVEAIREVYDQSKGH